MLRFRQFLIEFDTVAMNRARILGPVMKQYPDMIPPSGSFLNKGEQKPDNPGETLRAFDNLGIKYNWSDKNRQSSNIEDLRDKPVKESGYNISKKRRNYHDKNKK